MTAQVPLTTTLPSSSTAATATTWNPTQQHTIAEYFVKYNMETIPESLNGELSPLPSSSHGSSRGHTYNHTSNNQNLHVPKRSNTYTVNTSTSQNKHQRYAHAGASAESQSQQPPSSSINRSFSSPLSPQSDTGLGSRMIGGSKSTQRVKEWVKRSNSSRTDSKPKPGRSSSNSGHQTLEIIHLGGGRLESNGHIHSASLSSNFLVPSSHQQNRSSRANSIDSRVTQWSDLYHDPPESLTVITKPATATGKPSRPVSPELHERPLLKDLGSGSEYKRREGSPGRDHERDSQGHRHTKSDGSIHPAPLRIPSNSSSSSSLDKKDVGAAVTKPEERYWKGQALTRSNSKWKPLPVPPPPGAPGSVTPLVDSNGRSEDNINMSGAIGVSPLTSVDMSESEFGEREDTPRQQHQDRHGVQRGESRDRKHSPSNDASALGIGYAVGLGVLSPPLTPPEHNERAEHQREFEAEAGSATTCNYGIRESIWPVPPSYASSQPQGAPSRSATAPPEQQRQRQHQHSQKPSTSSSLASASTIASSQSVPTHVIPKRSDSLSYSRNRRPQHAPQLSTSTSASSKSTDKISGSGSGSQSSTDQVTAVATASTASFAHGVATRIDTSTSSPTVMTKTQAVPLVQTPIVTPPTPVVTLPTPPTALTSTPPVFTAATPLIPTVAGPIPIIPTPPIPTSKVLAPTVPVPEPKTPTWSPRSFLSSKELLWLHKNYRGLTPFFSAWGFHKDLNDEAEREEGLSIMRELMAAEVKGSHQPKAGDGPGSGRGHEGNEDGEEYSRDDKLGPKGDSSWLDFSPGPGDKRNTKTDDMKENGKEKETEAGQKGVNGYAALKGQGVRMKPRAHGDKETHGRKVFGNDNEEEGSDFF